MGQDEDQPEEGKGETSGWQYNPGGGSPVAPNPSFAATPEQPASNATGDVEWTASEFIAHDKSVRWYILLACVTIAVGALIYLITRDAFSTSVVAVLGVIIGIAGSRQPRVLAYRLDKSGLTAGNRRYPYSDYKSFVYLDEGPFASVIFLPQKRFGFPVSIYLAPEDEQKVLDAVSHHLPLERGEISWIDQLMRSMRF